MDNSWSSNESIIHVSRDIILPTMWHFDMNRLRRVCSLLLSLEIRNAVRSVA